MEPLNSSKACAVVPTGDLVRLFRLSPRARCGPPVAAIDAPKPRGRVPDNSTPGFALCLKLPRRERDRNRGRQCLPARRTVAIDLEDMACRFLQWMHDARSDSPRHRATLLVSTLRHALWWPEPRPHRRRRRRVLGRPRQWQLKPFTRTFAKAASVPTTFESHGAAMTDI